MRRFFIGIAIALLVALSGAAYAGMSDVTMLSLTNVVSNSATVDEEINVKDHAFWIGVTGTVPTSATFAVMSQPDKSSDFSNVVTFTATTFPAYVSFEAPFRYFRIQYTSKVGGDATTAFTVKYSDGVSLGNLY